MWLQNGEKSAETPCLCPAEEDGLSNQFVSQSLNKMCGSLWCRSCWFSCSRFWLQNAFEMLNLGFDRPQKGRLRGGGLHNDAV